MVIKNWQNQQNSFIFHMTPIAYEEKHCKIAQYCVYVCVCCCLILFFVKNYEKEGQNCRAQKLVDSTVLHGSAVAIIVG